MIASGNQNQLQSSLALLGDLLKALMFLSNLNSFNSFPHRRFKGLIKGKVLPRCRRKRAPSDSITFLFLSSCFFMCITYVFYFQVLSQSSFYALLCLTYFCLVIFQFFFSYKKIKIKKIQNSVCFVYIGTCVPWMAIETKFSKLCISCSLDEHLYAQLSK